MVAIAVIGILFAFSLIYFNFRYGHRRTIMQSHPSCNNLMLVGISFCLLAIIPMGLDGRFVSPSLFPVACGSGVWLLTLGFTLAFGAMFSKIWRVHRLATKTKSDSKTVSLIVEASPKTFSTIVSNMAERSTPLKRESCCRFNVDFTVFFPMP